MSRKAKAHPHDAPAAKTPDAKANSKLSMLTTLLRRSEGATIEALMAATGWQAHSIRGAISGGLKKKARLIIVSEKVDGVRVYRIVDGAAA